MKYMNNSRSLGYLLSDITLRIFWGVFALGWVFFFQKGFYLTYFSTIFLLFLLYILMKIPDVSELNKLPIFLFVVLGLFHRGIFLVLNPDDFSFSYSTQLTDEMLAGTFAYVSISLLILCFLFAISKVLRKKTVVVSYSIPALPTKLLSVSIGYYLFSIFLTAYLGIFHNVGMQGGESSSLGFLIRIFDIESGIVFVLLFGMASWKELSPIYRNTIFMILASFIFYTLFRGSRSGIYAIFLSAWFGVLALNPSFSIKRRHFLLAFISLIVIGVPSYFIGLAFRLYHIQQYDLDFVNVFEGFALLTMFSKISARLGEVDILAAVIYQLQLFDYTEYCSFLGTIDATIKGLLPSFLYKQTVLSIDQVFPYVFRGIPLDVIHGEHWTGPGAFIAYFNIYSAPFWTALFVFLASKLGDSIIPHIKNKQIAYVLSAHFSHTFFYGGLSTGSFSGITAVLIRFFIVLCLIRLVTRLTIKRGIDKPQTLKLYETIKK